LSSDKVTLIVAVVMVAAWIIAAVAWVMKIRKEGRRG
jgi:hypothetical protein